MEESEGLSSGGPEEILEYMQDFDFFIMRELLVSEFPSPRKLSENPPPKKQL